LKGTAHEDATSSGSEAISGDLSRELVRLAELHENNLLSDEEYKAAKAKVLGIS
jgi:hypothetical protein